MRMVFAGRGNGKGITRIRMAGQVMVAERNGLCEEGRMGKAERGIAGYPCSLNK
jgi:hypothetical protein